MMITKVKQSAASLIRKARDLHTEKRSFSMATLVLHSLPNQVEYWKKRIQRYPPAVKIITNKGGGKGREEGKEEWNKTVKEDPTLTAFVLASSRPVSGLPAHFACPAQSDLIEMNFIIGAEEESEKNKIEENLRLAEYNRGPKRLHPGEHLVLEPAI